MSRAMKRREDFSDRNVESLGDRKKWWSEEGAQALQDYRDARQLVLERMVELRKQRLAQLAKKGQ